MKIVYLDCEVKSYPLTNPSKIGAIFIIHMVGWLHLSNPRVSKFS